MALERPAWALVAVGVVAVASVASAGADDALDYGTAFQECMAEHDHAKAIVICTRAIKAFPGSEAQFRNGRARHLRSIGAADSALADYDRLIEIAPEAASFRWLRGHLLIELGKPDRALVDLRRALDLMKPDDALRPGLMEDIRALEALLKQPT
jgi:tetratricopeptide (TPR) repeat protein